jgi:hypothetical protein
MRAARVSGVLALAAVAASWQVLLVQPATALEPGVHVDPGSPAAKEYALPVSQARRAGEGGGGSEGTHEQLFGAGIKPPSSGSPRGGSPSGTTGGHRVARKRAGASSSRSADEGTSGASGTQPPALVRRVAGGRSSSGGGSSLLVLLGGGVVVVVLGAFAGVVLRHSRRPASTT